MFEALLWAFILAFAGLSVAQIEPISYNVLPIRAGPPSTLSQCANPPVDDCSFYATCLESRYQCGPNGYPIGYGQHFCQKFSDERDLLDAQGQEWMVNTMHCLQKVLVGNAIDAQATTCTALSHQAFGSHAECYLKNGVCTLGPHDWEAIFEIVGIKTLFKSWDAFKSSFEAAAGCGAFFAWVVENDLFQDLERRQGVDNRRCARSSNRLLMDTE
ncbi:hypothetical protein BOTBODRAFT_167643 [Botryobasidium botryosum FD-172 SS1]|uniref:Extracellular membrane protein CFEM domain-containing protein n=1 Tax=Botryobasidium botryosum (strain FD-172 SS1) TaxID=930990 RepID=A0A067M5R6_BOTB1|nr:hypothetical protein BOTBODRAFT_167643 [Botryobasidium botryosum FD-172 SS1]